MTETTEPQEAVEIAGVKAVVTKLSLEPDDILICQVPERTSQASLKHCSDMLKVATEGLGIRVFIVPDQISFKVVRQEESERGFGDFCIR